jgi:GR25 family glycosyltransferase involved in LPS biosynthesis
MLRIMSTGTPVNVTIIDSGFAARPYSSVTGPCDGNIIRTKQNISSAMRCAEMCSQNWKCVAYEMRGQSCDMIDSCANAVDGLCHNPRVCTFALRERVQACVWSFSSPSGHRRLNQFEQPLNASLGVCRHVPVDAPVFWINAVAQTSRRRGIEQMLMAADLTATRVPAINGLRVIELIAKSQISFTHPHMRLGLTIPNPQPGGARNAVYKGHAAMTFTVPEVGCILSHLNALRAAQLDESEWSIIIEDDAIVIPSTEIRTPSGGTIRLSVADVLRLAPDDADIIQLHVHNTHIAKRMCMERKLFSPWSIHNWGTTAYAIRRAALTALLDSTGTPPIIGDNLVADVFLYANLRAYTVSRPFVTLAKSVSTVQLTSSESQGASLDDLSRHFASAYVADPAICEPIDLPCDTSAAPLDSDFITVFAVTQTTGESRDERKRVAMTMALLASDRTYSVTAGVGSFVAREADWVDEVAHMRAAGVRAVIVDDSVVDFQTRLKSKLHLQTRLVRTARALGMLTRWVLIFDDDVSFPDGYLTSYFASMPTRAMLSQPTIRHARAGDAQYIPPFNHAFWTNRSTPRMLVVPFVEVQVLMIDVDFLIWFLDRVANHILAAHHILGTVAGTDCIWCAAAREYVASSAVTNGSVGCALLPSISVLHSGGRTLKKDVAFGKELLDMKTYLKYSWPQWYAHPPWVAEELCASKKGKVVCDAVHFERYLSAAAIW